MATHLENFGFRDSLALTELYFYFLFAVFFALLVPMSDENVSSGRGRWDHLLREIPTKKSKSAPAPKKEKKSLPPPNNLFDAAFQDEQISLSPEVEETVYQVSDINRAIKFQLENQFHSIWVQGEISNFKAHTSGHFYFSLKDAKTQINGVMFKGYNARLKFNPENGMEVLVRGKISVYEPRGTYQVFCEHMEPVGAGALQKAFEQLKAKLQKEGLFDESHKQPLPQYPKSIAVVTSPTGAAIQDILNVLGRRSKRAQVTVIPARVQGDGAAAEVVGGIEIANRVGGFDVLIVGRGGGSLEDLWCFNEESVARAIFKSIIPVISAVGHEIDFTIADFVADMRAPTPSAAAEVVVKSEEELREKLKFCHKSLRLLVYQNLDALRAKIKNNRTRLINPKKFVEDSMMRLDDWNQRLMQATRTSLETRRMKVRVVQKSLINPITLVTAQQSRNQNLFKMLSLTILQRLNQYRSGFRSQISLLDSLSPLRTVDRGYGIVRSEGKLIPDVKSLKSKSIEIQLRDGFIDAEVTGTRKKEKS